jgi:phosphatidylserine decarboxylase
MKKIKDLKGNEINDEDESMYFKFLLKTQIIISNKVLKLITLNYCNEFKKKANKKEIIDFINKYNIKWKESIKCKDKKNIEECALEFKSINDLFKRKKNPELIKIYKEKDKKYLVSNSYSRVMILENKIKHWIKGSEFTINSSLNIKSPILKEYYKNAYILINRLAPTDYHRFHSSIDGYYIGSYLIDGEYYSVNKKIVNSKINVYTENKRITLFIKSNIFGIVALSIVGATCVGSIKLKKMKKGYFIKKGSELGYFQFGGSTIITYISRENNIKINPKIKRNINKKTETYLEVGNYILRNKTINNDLIRKNKDIIDEIYKEIN